MNTATISIEVDEKAARAFKQATEKEQRDIALLLSMRFKELTENRHRSLSEMMDGARAQAKDDEAPKATLYQRQPHLKVTPDELRERNKRLSEALQSFKKGRCGGTERNRGHSNEGLG